MLRATPPRFLAERIFKAIERATSKKMCTRAVMPRDEANFTVVAKKAKSKKNFARAKIRRRPSCVVARCGEILGKS